jgi:hypothetical protein
MALRNRRTSVVAATAAALMILALSVQVATASSHFSVTIVGSNPGIIDLNIASVDFDARSGGLTVTGSVDCAEPLDLLFVDFTAVQTRLAVTTGFSTVVPECAQPFSAAIQTDSPFGPGRLVIDASAFGCAAEGGCAAEVVRIDARLMPHALQSRPAACPDPSHGTHHLARDTTFARACITHWHHLPPAVQGRMTLALAR